MLTILGHQYAELKLEFDQLNRKYQMHLFSFGFADEFLHGVGSLIQIFLSPSQLFSSKLVRMSTWTK